MKAHLSVFALSAILIASIGIAPAFGQIQNSIVVTTDKSSYSEGDVILVTGEVRELYSGTPVSLIVQNDKAIVALAQLTVGADKKFSTEITAGGTMRTAGTYTVEVTYGTQNRIAVTSFEFEGSTATPSSGNPRITDTTVSIEGSSDLIGYKITGGKLLNIMPDVEAKSLIVSIDATSDGSLTLTIPRSILDSTMNGEDDDFFVLIDGEEVDFDETTTSTDRTLTIAFQAGAEEIEIIGTFVIPEFGAIAAMILAVAIISTIAISARSRLSIMPRY
ncbi:MAG: PEFG-CTERM sorting domain-containing protein [Nitrosopumilus sp.]|nr:PEFG-CTERM sorting domain-containing protein [Nitrosopumilus sp.]